MNKKRAATLLPIFTAFSEGKAIECRRNTSKDNWSEVANLSWGDDIEYRIKQEPECIPFTLDDNLVGAIIIPKTQHGKDVVRSMVIEQDLYFVHYNGGQLKYETLLAAYTFLNGDPCGKLSQPEISD